MALFGISAVLDIAEKIHNWGRDKKNEKEEEKKQDEPSMAVLVFDFFTATPVTVHLVSSLLLSRLFSCQCPSS